MSQDDNVWKEYYQKIKGRAPRPLLLDVLAYYPETSTQRTGLRRWDRICYWNMAGMSLPWMANQLPLSIYWKRSLQRTKVA